MHKYRPILKQFSKIKEMPAVLSVPHAVCTAV